MGEAHNSPMDGAGWREQVSGLGERAASQTHEGPLIPQALAVLVPMWDSVLSCPILLHLFNKSPVSTAPRGLTRCEGQGYMTVP